MAPASSLSEKASEDDLQLDVASKSECEEKLLEVSLDRRTGGESDDGEVVEEGNVGEVRLGGCLGAGASGDEGDGGEEGDELALCGCGSAVPAFREDRDDLTRWERSVYKKDGREKRKKDEPFQQKQDFATGSSPPLRPSRSCG